MPDNNPALNLPEPMRAVLGAVLELTRGEAEPVAPFDHILISPDGGTLRVSSVPAGAVVALLEAAGTPLTEQQFIGAIRTLEDAGLLILRPTRNGMPIAHQAKWKGMMITYTPADEPWDCALLAIPPESVRVVLGIAVIPTRKTIVSAVEVIGNDDTPNARVTNLTALCSLKFFRGSSRWVS